MSTEELKKQLIEVIERSGATVGSVMTALDIIHERYVRHKVYVMNAMPIDVLRDSIKKEDERW
jgi:hypothetical protein